MEEPHQRHGLVPADEEGFRRSSGGLIRGAGPRRCWAPPAIDLGFERLPGFQERLQVAEDPAPTAALVLGPLTRDDLRVYRRTLEFVHDGQAREPRWRFGELVRQTSRP